jgi:hypothetical protein
LDAHAVLHQLALAMCGAFSTPFLLKRGLAPSSIFLTLSAVLAFRFCFRPLVLLASRWAGLRTLLVFGVVLSAIQYPVLAAVRGVDVVLLLYCLITATANTFYWTSYHALFAVAGESRTFGGAVGRRQILVAASGMAGPIVGGAMLAYLGPWMAFTVAAMVELFGTLPLLNAMNPRVERVAPAGAYRGARLAAWLFGTDAWVMSTAIPAWNIIVFQALGNRFDEFGTMLAVATLASTLGGRVFSRLLDRGWVTHAILINALAIALSLIVRAVSGTGPTIVIVVAIATTLLWGAYVPSLMAASYRETKNALCPLRSQFAAEGSWDFFGVLASGTAALLAMAGLPLQWTLILALPGVVLQAWLLRISYARFAFEVNEVVAATSTPAPAQ